MNNNMCAIYVRYSNIDVLNGEGLGRSIANQIEVLTKYANDNCFRIYKVYSDYHQSGKNFDRPMIKELLDDANCGFFKTILVKDLSRFGRNYLEVGQFIDEVFPEKGIRFIAVNDHFDSSRCSDYLSIAVKNFMNSYYLKDIARKIRRTMALRAEKEPIVSYHYGYWIKNKTITIDENEAVIVKRIFEEFQSGKELSEIAAGLVKDKVLSPRASRFLKYQRTDQFEALSEEKKYFWNYGTVKRILKDSFYTGTTVNFRKESHVRCSEKRNIVLENSHPAIITQEEFEQVDERRFTRANMDVIRESLNHIIYDEKVLGRNGCDRGRAGISPNVDEQGKVYYHNYHAKEDYPSDIMEHRIYDEVLLRHQYIAFHKEEVIKQYALELKGDNAELSRAIKEKAEKQELVSTIFERYMNGEIEESDYQKKMALLRTDLKNCETIIQNTKACMVDSEEMSIRVNRFLNLFYESEDMIKVIKEFVDFALYDPRDGSIDIVFKFETELGLPSKSMQALVHPDVIKGSEFNLQQMILEILTDTPNIKIATILEKVRKTWSGFTYTMVKKAMQKLEHQGKVEMEGDSRIIDGYRLVGQEEDFDYKGMRLNRSEKEVYKLLCDNPRLSYADIAKKRGFCESQARSVVISLRNKGAFVDEERFPRDFVPEGSIYTIFMRIPDPKEEDFKKYIFEHPMQNRCEIAAGLNVHEGQVKRLLLKYGFTRPYTKGPWKYKNKEIGNETV